MAVAIAESRPLTDPAALEGEDEISFTKLAQELDCHVGQIHDAHQRGTLSRPLPTGERRRIYLAGYKRFGRYVTTREAYRRYIRAVNGIMEPGDSDGSPSVSTRRTAAQRRAAVEQANHRAEALGA